MNDELRPGVLQEIAAGVRRLIAPNPGMMTGPGTNTYLLGEKDIAVIDPGPFIRSHTEAIRELAAAPIRWILVTHTHPDHSPAARQLAKVSGAELIGRPAPAGRHQDRTFRPDRILQDGEALHTAEFRLQALHTPGHASNHLCYLHESQRCLFTGDHIINGSTVVIDPPDGNMRDYIASLERLRKLDVKSIAPGHGEVFENPAEVIDWIIGHRLQRESKVVAALQARTGSTAGELVPQVYDDVAADRHAMAERSLLAHLQKLAEEQRAACNDGRWRLL
jgi:glyoxylase-like metal-dependent hydrolase (beta-lactamase superfamily II)